MEVLYCNFCRRSDYPEFVYLERLWSHKNRVNGVLVYSQMDTTWKQAVGQSFDTGSVSVGTLQVSGCEPHPSRYLFSTISFRNNIPIYKTWNCLYWKFFEFMFAQVSTYNLNSFLQKKNAWSELFRTLTPKHDTV